MSEYLDPATREEMYLDVIRRIAEGETVDVSNLIEPVSRVERYLYDIAKNFTPGGSSVTVEPLTVTENGEYDAGEGKAYSPVEVDVPNSYAAGDEGKVVSSGALVAQTAYPSTVTANDTYDTTLYDRVTVNVPNTNGKVPHTGTIADIFTGWTQDEREDLVGGISDPANCYSGHIEADISVLQIGMQSIILPLWWFPTTSKRQFILAALSTPDGNGGLVNGSVGWSVTDGSLTWMYLEQGGQVTDVSQYTSYMPAALTTLYHPGLGDS